MNAKQLIKICLIFITIIFSGTINFASEKIKVGLGGPKEIPVAKSNKEANWVQYEMISFGAAENIKIYVRVWSAMGALRFGWKVENSTNFEMRDVNINRRTFEGSGKSGKFGPELISGKIIPGNSKAMTFGDTFLCKSANSVTINIQSPCIDFTKHETAALKVNSNTKTLSGYSSDNSMKTEHPDKQESDIDFWQQPPMTGNPVERQQVYQKFLDLEIQKQAKIQEEQKRKNDEEQRRNNEEQRRNNEENSRIEKDRIAENASVNIQQNPVVKDTKVDEKKVDAVGRFTRDNEGIINDSQTNLQWYRGENSELNWYDTQKWVEELSVAGGRWRMPTRNELTNLFSSSESNIYFIPKEFHSGVNFWSSETTVPKREHPLVDNSTAWFYQCAQKKEDWGNRDARQYYGSFFPLAVRDHR